MKSKATVTQEQANAIEELKKDNSNKDMVWCNINPFSGAYIDENRAILSKMDFDTLMVALYIGYEEIPPKFKVGDWITHRQEKTIFRISEIHPILTEGGNILLEGYGGWYDPGEFRHSTPEEITTEKQLRFWNSHNRNVWELKEGDILEYLGDLLIVDSCDLEDVSFENSDAVNLDYVKKHFKVVCFVEDRKDARQ